MSKPQFTLLLVFSILIIISVGLATSLVSPLISVAPEPTLIAISFTSPTETSVPTETSTRRSLPPTWTPAPSITPFPSETFYHSDMLAWINARYDNLVNEYTYDMYYYDRMGDITIASLYSYWIKEANADRKQEIDQENKRYAAIAAYYVDKTQFVLSTYLSPSENKTVSHCSGPGSGYTLFESNGEMHYFTVISSGSWYITVTVSK